MGLARPKTKAQQAATLTATPARTGATAVTLADALARWDVHLQASERIKSPRTLDAYRYGVAKLVAHLGSQYAMHDITAEHIEALMAALKAGGMSPGGRAVVYRPLRTFFKWCVTRGLVTTSPMDVVAAPVVKEQPVEFVTDDEWAAILRTTETRSRWAFRARRDRAILLMLGTTGARLSEVAALRIGDIDVESKTFTVHGKGGKDRVLPLLDNAWEALSAYLTLERPRNPYSGTTTALWLAPRGELSASGIAQLVAERGKTAGLRRRVHPHELRHRFVARALAGGMPAPLVMALSGHSTPSMLNRYGAHSRAQDAMAFLRAMG